MLEIHKQYVFDQNGKAIAVQISIEEFEQIENKLKASEQGISVQSCEETQQDCELVEVDGILMLKAQGAEQLDIVELVKHQREARITDLEDCSIGTSANLSLYPLLHTFS